jgi:hypothetical protein
MRRPILAGLVLALLAPLPALAAVPSTISYQGMLTDNLGVPVADGSYDMSFRIYDVPSGGAALFSEDHSGANAVAISKGNLSVVLGSLVTLDLPFNVPYWLGITIGRDPELTPRVPLTSAPYSLALRMPFAGEDTLPTPVLRITNLGTGAAIQADPRLDVGTPTRDGKIQCYQNGSANPAATIQGIGGVGGAVETLDEAGNITNLIVPEIFQSEGGYLSTSGNAAGTRFFTVDGNSDGAGNPTLTLLGSQSEVVLDSGASGDAAVQLPPGSISSTELSNEPGVSQGLGASSVSITSKTTFQDMVTTTISIPAPGYVVVDASSYVTLVFGTQNSIVSVQIDETAGGGVDAAHNVQAGFSTTANILPMYLPVSTRRTYFKSAAGTYTFRLEARLEGTSDGSATLTYPVITALYVPTSYGTVNQIVNVADASEFPESRRDVTASDRTTQPVTMVDLRELELRAARAEAEAQRTARDVAEARARELRARITRTAIATGSRP